MIVPMKKISLVVLENERKEALKALRKLGVLHVEEIQGSSEELASYKDQNSKIEKALAILTEIKLGKKETPKQTLVGKEAAFDIAKNILALTDEKKSCFDRITNDSVELERFAKWGGVNPADFVELSEENIHLALYEIPSDKYALIGEEAKTVIVSKDKSQTRFVLVSEKPFAVNERPEGLPAEAYQVPLPRISTEALKKEIADSKARIVEIENEIKASVQYKNALKDSVSVIAKDIELENLYSGMGIEENLSWITGFVPVDSMAAFESFAKSEKWAFAASDPSDDDAVPTKLKNNKLVSLIYPLTDFLGTVPGYHEYDISGWFLAFFTIFFGMIFGDGGYGALVTAVALIFILKSLFGGKKVSPMLGLVLLLGLATMVWGAVTCTWFGLTPEQLPDWIVALSVPPISNACADVQWIPFWTSDASAGTLGTAQNLQIFCFTLALIQLCVAHLKGMGRYIKDKAHRLKFLGEAGSFVQLIGMYWVVLSMVVDGNVFPLMGGDVYGLPWGTISIAMVGGGFAFSFVFANYEGSVAKSILESVKNIISVLLGVVNVFSDIVSYIRLWAVGLAGAAISGTVNTFAGPLVGHAALFIVLIVLLVFGHGLNMILNLLSVIVHGVRLNTLEFSNHLGMSWAGFKYEPLKE
ncbi:MAG: ATPase [Treponema sp.]|uniref:V-type ATP synthase subunit I n=1 Tax=Treponema sp. TaxID=166 RepID=UPI0025F463FE|nr:ATPase [Treponema sp.]MBQ8679120.1 ATPase [Treponema sp.]